MIYLLLLLEVVAVGWFERMHDVSVCFTDWPSITCTEALTVEGPSYGIIDDLTVSRFGLSLLLGEHN